MKFHVCHYGVLYYALKSIFFQKQYKQVHFVQQQMGLETINSFPLAS